MNRAVSIQQIKYMENSTKSYGHIPKAPLGVTMVHFHN